MSDGVNLEAERAATIQQICEQAGRSECGAALIAGRTFSAEDVRILAGAAGAQIGPAARFDPLAIPSRLDKPALAGQRTTAPVASAPVAAQFDPATIPNRFDLLGGNQVGCGLFDTLARSPAARIDVARVWPGFPL